MSWQKEFQNSLRTSDQICTYFNLPEDEISKNYQGFIPLNFAKKILRSGHNGPLWKQFIPSDFEDHEIQSYGLFDPIGDQVHAKDGPLIHRYSNRALFSPTTVCPIQCRYCFRKNELSEGMDFLDRSQEKAFEYLENHPEINEVIFTGGDPLILSDIKLEYYLDRLSKIKSIKFVRFHSRTPVILPERLCSPFINLWQKYKKVFTNLILVIHTNHESELDDDFAHWWKEFRQVEPSALSQSVMLKDVNDNPEALTALIYRLVDLGIRPYYLHHPDLVRGAMHFWLPLEQGRRVYTQLRNQIPGWALPQYMVDIPGGEGKVNAFNPEGHPFSGKLINKDGDLTDYKKIPVDGHLSTQ
jgi:lysine 2,3-aminomutase